MLDPDGRLMGTSRFGRRFTSALTIAGLGVVLSASSGLAASVDDAVAAPASTSQCPTGNFCVWSTTVYSGAVATTASTAATNTTFTHVGSVWNRSAKAAVVYPQAGGAGTATCYAPGAQLGSTSLTVGSIRILATASC